MRILYTNGAAFEDGTLNLLSIAAVPAGLDLLGGIGMERIGQHVMALTEQLLRGLLELRHSDGSPLVRINGPPPTERRGGTVAFNLIDREGRVIDCRHVEQAASEASASSQRTRCGRTSRTASALATNRPQADSPVAFARSRPTS